MKYLILAVLALFFIPQLVLAHNEDLEPVATSSSTASFNSFEAFWPLTAGKTLGDSMYFLKTLKEDLRGILIFGKPEKGEYLVFRSTKRILEAESLINSKKDDLALKTVETANVYLTQSKANLDGLTGREDLKVAVKNRLDQLIKLVDELVRKTSGETHTKLEATHTLIEENLQLVRK